MQSCSWSPAARRRLTPAQQTQVRPEPSGLRSPSIPAPQAGHVNRQPTGRTKTLKRGMRPLLLALALALRYCCAEEEERQLYGTDGLAQRCRGVECTPLLWGCAGGTGSLVDAQKAIDGGADVDFSDVAHGSTALMKASHAGREELVRLLLAAGAGVDARQREGATALMAAAQGGHTGTVALLLHAGAEPLLRSKPGWWYAGTTAYEVALREGHTDTAQWLRAAEDHAASEEELATQVAAAEAWKWEQHTMQAPLALLPVSGDSWGYYTLLVCLDFVCGRLLMNVLGRRLLAPNGFYLPGPAANLLSVLLLPMLWLALTLGGGSVLRHASVPAVLAVTTLLGTPLVWLCILRRDTSAAAAMRAAARPGGGTPAAAGARPAGMFRNNPAAATGAASRGRNRGNQFTLVDLRNRRRTPVPQHLDFARPPAFNPELLQAAGRRFLTPTPGTSEAVAAVPQATNTAEPPSDFSCPVTQELMVDPVILADGHSYERVAIAHWLSTHGTSPKTNARLEDKRMVPNHTLRGSIEQFKEQHPEFRRQ